MSAAGMVTAIPAGKTYALRHRILRPNQALTDCAYPLDHATGTFHAGLFVEGRLTGVGSVFREAEDGATDTTAWRIRGMAVDEAAQGRGYGGRILQALLRHAAAFQDEGIVWCNGRTRVESFYVRHGFRRVGDVFDLPPIGPHVLLRRPLTKADRRLAP